MEKIIFKKKTGKATFCRFLDKFAKKLEKAYDDYQELLDEMSEKIVEQSGYERAVCLLNDDGSIEVKKVDDGDVGITIIDMRDHKEYDDAVKFFHLLTTAESASEFDYLSENFPSQMADKDVDSYVRWAKRELGIREEMTEA